MAAVTTIAGFLLLMAPAFGQTPLAFEVVSIKASQAEPGSLSAVNTDKGRIAARNVTLRRCMRAAFDVPESRILGGPKWADEERYDIDAKAAGPADGAELAAMIQSMLAERFQLVFHRETRPLPGYALLLGKGGVKAKPSGPDTPSRAESRRGEIDAAGCSMRQLALKLSESLHLPVADLTGIEGRFDFKLEWTPDDMHASAAADAAGPSIFTALQEQLGLKLEGRKIPTEVLVIDRAEKASAN